MKYIVLFGICIFILVGVSTMVNAALTDNLISYYKADEGSGNLIDVNSRINLTLTGTVSNQSAKLGAGARGAFSTANYFRGSSSTLYNTGWNNTHALWMKRTSGVGSEQDILCTSTSGAGQFAVYSDSTNPIDLYYNPTSACNVKITTSYALTNNQWYYVVFTYNSAATTNLSMYINGTLVSNSTACSGAGVASSWMTIGVDYRSSALRGSANWYVDEVGYWNRTLTQSEITQLYNSGNGLAYPFSVAPADTCTCPVTNTNWDINKADNCVIGNCDIGSGNVSTYGIGNNVQINGTFWSNRILNITDFILMANNGISYGQRGQ